MEDGSDSYFDTFHLDPWDPRADDETFLESVVQHGLERDLERGVQHPLVVDNLVPTFVHDMDRITKAPLRVLAEPMPDMTVRSFMGQRSEVDAMMNQFTYMSLRGEGSRYFSRYANKTTKEALYENTPKDSEGFPVDGTKYRRILAILERQRQRLTTEKKPSIKASQDAINVNLGNQSPRSLAALDEGYAFAFAQELYSGMSSATYEFYLDMIAPLKGDFENEDDPVAWVRNRAERLLGFVESKDMLKDFMPHTVLTALSHMVTTACNSAMAPGHTHRRFNRTPDTERWLKLTESWDPQSASALLTFCLNNRGDLDIDWFVPSGETSTLPIREKFKYLREWIDQGFDIDRLSTLYKKLARQSGATEATLLYALDLVDKVYTFGDDDLPRWHRPNEDWTEHGHYDFLTKQSGRVGAVAPWVLKDQDLSNAFDDDVSQTGVKNARLNIGVDDRGIEIVKTCFDLAGSEALPCIRAYQKQGYRLKTKLGFTEPEAIELSTFITLRYGIADLDRAVRVIDMALDLLSGRPAEMREEDLANFKQHLHTQAPINPFWAGLEDEKASVDFPGLRNVYLSITGNTDEPGAQLSNNLTAAQLNTVSTTLALPPERRSSLAPLIKSSLNRTPILTRQAQTRLGIASTVEGTEADNGLSGMVKLYQQAETEGVEIVTVETYLTFCAAKMPEPFSPPAGFLKLLEKYERIMESGALGRLMFANPFDGEKAEMRHSNLQNYVDRFTLLADFIEIWASGGLSYKQLEAWLEWITGSVSASVKEQIKAEVLKDCEILHPENVEGLDQSVLGQRLVDQQGLGREHLGKPYTGPNPAWEDEIDKWDDDYSSIRHDKFSWNLNADSAERYQASVDFQFNHRVEKLEDQGQERSWDRLNTWSALAPALGIFFSTMNAPELFGPVFARILTAVQQAEMGNKREVSDLLKRIEKLSYYQLHESESLPDYLVDKQRLKAGAAKCNDAWELIEMFLELQRTYTQSVQVLERARHNFIARIDWSNDDGDLLKDVRANLSRVWEPLTDLVAPGVAEKILENEFDVEGLVSLAKAVQGFKRNVIDTSSELAEEVNGSFYYGDRGHALRRNTNTVLTLGSVGAGLQGLKAQMPEASDRAEVVFSKEEASLPDFLQVDFTRNADQMQAAFERELPNLKAQMETWRATEFGLQPVGAKVHTIDPFDGTHIRLLQDIFDLNDTSFRLIHADQSLILPPVMSSQELKYMLAVLESFGVFKGDLLPELQLTGPGRLESRELQAVLASAVILNSSTNYAYEADSFSTSHDAQTAARMMTYDAGQRNDDLPFMYGLDGRTDILGRFSADDAMIFRFVSSVLTQLEHGVGPYQKLGEQFLEDFKEKVLKPHGLNFILKAPWLHDRERSGTRSVEIENKQHIKAVNACVNGYFKAARYQERRGEPAPIMHAVNTVWDDLMQNFSQARDQALADPQWAKDKEKLFEI